MWGCGAEWWSQFSREMSFAPGKEGTLAEDERGCVLAAFTARRGGIGWCVTVSRSRKRGVCGGGGGQPVN